MSDFSPQARLFALAALGMVPLAGACATAMSAAPAVSDPASADTCQAAPGQAFIGREATSANGAELIRVTGSRELRWVAPGMAVTMDYKIGRLTVAYDQAMRIISVACG